MNKQDCISALAKKFGLSEKETARLYDDVMEVVEDAAKKEGVHMDGWDMEAEFIRLADPASKQRIALAATEEIDRRMKKKTAKILMTNNAAINAEARIMETLMNAMNLGRLKDKKGWYSNWGKTDPVQAILSFMIGDGSGLPGSRRSISSMREAFDREDFGTLIDFFMACRIVTGPTKFRFWFSGL